MIHTYTFKARKNLVKEKYWFSIPISKYLPYNFRYNKQEAKVP